MSSKSKIVTKGGINVKGGVYGGNRRWNASRLESAVKNKGNRMIRKSKQGKS